MYRKRLRSPAGCLRCKNRHRKCDEKRPQCSFCARHDLKCLWPTTTRSQPRKRTDIQLAAITSSELNAPVREPTRDSKTAGLDPFHNIPVHSAENAGVIMDYLHQFFRAIIENSSPFDTADCHDRLIHGWLASVHSDEAVCTAFVTYCAYFYSTRTVRPSRLAILSLKSEARSLALLRNRIEGDKPVTEGTLLAAALHLFIAIFSTQDTAQLSRIAQGIYALITARGGPSATMRNVSFSTRQSLMLVDVCNSLLTAQKPFLEVVQLPPKPPSYDSLFKASTIHQAIVDCLEQEVTDLLEDMRFALFFRAPSQQTRKLSSAESRYLYVLLQRIGHEVCVQQSRLVSSQSISKIAVYGIIIVNIEVLPNIAGHRLVPTTILKRLRDAVSTYGSSLRGPGLTITLWACMMTLVSTEFEVERRWALEFITRKLADRHGRLWPRDWIAQLRQELQQVLWHDRIEVAFTKTCARAFQLCSHIVDTEVGLQDDQLSRRRLVRPDQAHLAN